MDGRVRSSRRWRSCCRAGDDAGEPDRFRLPAVSHGRRCSAVAHLAGACAARRTVRRTAQLWRFAMYGTSYACDLAWPWRSRCNSSRYRTFNQGRSSDGRRTSPESQEPGSAAEQSRSSRQQSTQQGSGIRSQPSSPSTRRPDRPRQQEPEQGQERQISRARLPTFADKADAAARERAVDDIDDVDDIDEEDADEDKVTQRNPAQGSRVVEDQRK